jgi:hypothetical protein
MKVAFGGASEVTPTPSTATVDGLLDLATPVSTGFRLRGWACTVGVNGASTVHVRAKPAGSTGIGTWIKTLTTNESTSYSTTVCKNSGRNVFDVTLPRSAIASYVGQQVVLVVRNNRTGEYTVLDKSPFKRFR